jgi:hypothetical protein
VRADLLASLIETVESGEAVLFTGAGFSMGACDTRGQLLPDSEGMRRELWQLVFGDDNPDESTLQDLYDVALDRVPDQLAAYLRTRLCAGTLAPHHAVWFSMPWRRIYTLNVDDVDALVQQERPLPRALRICSSTRLGDAAQPDALDVIHLNGLAREGCDGLTFSTLQYAARLCGRDHAYATLVDDLARFPFVFAGTTLDEVVLWQHLELKRRDGAGRAPLRPSYLIARTLSRARQLLLEGLGVTWIPTTIEEVSERLAETAGGPRPGGGLTASSARA